MFIINTFKANIYMVDIGVFMCKTFRYLNFLNFE